MKRILILIITTILCLSSCERDDICAESTSTTPQLYLKFYSIINQSENNVKAVSNLYVIGDSNDTPLTTTISAPGDLVTTEEILLPLKTIVENEDGTTQVKYLMYFNYTLDNNETPDDTSDDKEDYDNLDIITITYKPQEVYVSRACGYKTIFTDVSIAFDEGDDGRWIDNITANTTETTIENQDEAHYNFYH